MHPRLTFYSRLKRRSENYAKIRANETRKLTAETLKVYSVKLWTRRLKEQRKYTQSCERKAEEQSRKGQTKLKTF